MILILCLVFILCYSIFLKKGCCNLIKSKGFSLIELLVVIAIIGILAATATPVYLQYQARAKIFSAIKLVMENIIPDAKKTYASKGVWPTTISANGTTITQGNWTVTPSYGNVYSMSYRISGDGAGISLGVNITGLAGLGIPNYVTPTVANPPNPSYSILNINLRDFNGAIRTICGNTTFGIYTYQNLPMNYLPGTCQCTDAEDFLQTGTGGC